MTDRFIIEPVGEAVLLDSINRAIQGLQQPRRLYDAIGATLEENVNDRFRIKTDPNGAAWAPLSEITLQLYWMLDKDRQTEITTDDSGAQVFPPMPGTLLERSRFMLESLTHNATSDGVDVGFSVPYAIYHETGTKRGDKPYMPRRGMLMADPEAGTLGEGDREDVQSVIEDYVARLLGRTR